MLELMLTRPRDRRSLIRMARGLEFLVFDELHTYRGRQGADVAMLIRRVKDACAAPDVQCVGTSATMSTEGTGAQRRDGRRRRRDRDLRHRRSTPEHVIGETLIRATAEDAGPVTAARIAAPGRPVGYADLVARPAGRPGSRPRSGWTATTRATWPGARRSTVHQAARELAGADGHRRGAVREGAAAHPAGRVAGQAPASPAGRCSRSGCTSSCPRATPST